MNNFTEKKSFLCDNSIHTQRLIEDVLAAELFGVPTWSWAQCQPGHQRRGQGGVVLRSFKRLTVKEVRDEVSVGKHMRTSHYDK